MDFLLVLVDSRPVLENSCASIIGAFVLGSMHALGLILSEMIRASG